MQLIDHKPGLNLLRVSPSNMDGDQLIIQRRKSSSPAQIANIKKNVGARERNWNRCPALSPFKTQRLQLELIQRELHWVTAHWLTFTTPLGSQKLIYSIGLNYLSSSLFGPENLKLWLGGRKKKILQCFCCNHGFKLRGGADWSKGHSCRRNTRLSQFNPALLRTPAK